MKSLDVKIQEQADLLKQVHESIAAGDAKEAAEKMAVYTNSVQEAVLAEARALMSEADQRKLSERGVRSLTQEEKRFYENLKEAAKAPVPQMALSNLKVALPRTVVDSVMQDIIKEHPLLGMITFVDANGLVEFLVNTGNKELATWSKLCSKFVTELSGDFKVVSLTQGKLSAFIPVCKAMLEIGPEWLDRYVRALLSNAISYGLEEGIINGTGVDQPVGMVSDLSKDFNASTGFPKKAAKKVESFEPASYGPLLAELAKDGMGSRKISDVCLIVNPADYFARVMPAVTLATPAGYAQNILPYPTTIIQSEQVEAGKAILGLPKRYWMGVSIGNEGRIEYSDEYRFVDDERVYAAKLYGTGMPLDNNAFILLDISKLKPLVYKVETSTAHAGGPVA